MPNNDKWAQYEEKSSPASTATADKWEQYAQPASQASSPSFVPNARIRNLPNPAAGIDSPGRALYEGAKTGVAAASLPLAVMSPGTALRGLAGGAIGSGAASYGAKKLGAGEFGQEVAGDVGGLAGGAATEGLFQLGKAPIGRLLTTPEGKPSLGLRLVAPKRAGAIAEFFHPDEPPPPPSPPASPFAGATSTVTPVGNAALPAVPEGPAPTFPKVQKLADIRAAQRAEAAAAKQAAKAAARKGGMTPPPNPFPDATSSATPIGGAELPTPTGSPTPFPRVMTRAELAAQAKAAAEAAAPPKPAAPSPFAGMTSTAAPIGNAPLPEVPQGSPTPFPTVQPKVKVAGAAAAPATGAEPAGPTGTSLLSRGRTLVTPGLEPDLNNPVHAKMINDYQTMSGPALRQLANAGDRFAAFVLRHMPRP